MANYKFKNSEGIVFDTNSRGIGIPTVDDIANAPTSSIAQGSILYAIAQKKIYSFDGSVWVVSAGTSGSAGSSGTAGSSGSSGTAGSSGSSGQSGAAGSSGSSGTSGANGSSGSSGTSGSSGSTGSSGSSGSTGTSGSSGSTGSSGSSGSTGTSGSSGSSGVSLNWRSTYSAGTTYSINDIVYYNGTSYVSLINSNIGNTPSSSPAQWAVIAQAGSSGSSGSSGASGSSGSSGQSGAAGSSGSSGSSGQSGAAGSSGSSGSSGQSGAAGSSGSSGSSGQSGAAGSSGSSGSSGQSGAAGSSGSSGSSGQSAATAITNNTDNYVVTATGSGTTPFNGESGLTYNGSKLALTGNSSAIALDFANTVPNNPLFIGTYGGWSGIGMDQTTAGLRLAGDISGTNPIIDFGYYPSGTVSHANWSSKVKILNNGVTTVTASSTASPGLYVLQTGSSGYSAIQWSGNNGTDKGVLTTYSGSIYIGRWNGGNGAYGDILINTTNGNVTFGSSISASNLSGTNTGDQTLSGLGGVAKSGDTMTGSLSFSNSSGIFINRSAGAATGINWYNSGYLTWTNYMSPASTAGCGPTGNITAPSGTYVTSWALRSHIENSTGYGWTWESGTGSTGQPSVVAEIRSSDGLFRAAGAIYSGSNLVLHAGNYSTYAVSKSGDTMSGNLTLSGYQNPHITLTSSGGSYSYIELNDGTSNGYLIKNTSLSTSNGVLAGALYTYTDNSKAFQHVHSGTPLFTILSTGNTGIGTVSPSKTLHVYTSGNEGIFLQGTGGGVWMDIQASGGQIHSVGAQVGGMGIYNRSSSAYRLFITDAGYFGIGNTSPSSILQLGAGSYTATNSSYNTFHAGGFSVLFRDVQDAYVCWNTNYTASGWWNKYSGKSGIVYVDSSGDYYLETGSGTTAGAASSLSVKFKVDNSGNGTFTGSVKATTNVIVNSGNNSSSSTGGLTLWDAGGTTTSWIGFKNNANTGWNYHGGSTSSGAYSTYFIMDTASRGWIWRYASPGGTNFAGTNVASIQSDNGAMALGSVWDGTSSNPIFAQLNVCQGRAAATNYRDIDMKGSWAAGEGHSITATHGTTSSDIVGQITFQHDSPGSRIRFGKLYASGNQTTYPMELISNSSGGGGNLYVTGDITAYYSDERLKTKVADIDNALAKVLSLSGFKYVNNALAKEHGYDSDNVQIGLSAQEVQKVAPEIVKLAHFDMEIMDGKIASKSGENYLTLDYSKLVPILVEAIKEQQNQIEDLKKALFNIIDSK